MRYRSSLDRLQEAIDSFERVPVSFLLQLGDIIDGNETEAQTKADLLTAVEPFRQCGQTVHHTIGNHCRSVGRQTLLEVLELERPFYGVQVHEGWRVIVLNGADIYGAAVDARHADRVEARELCRKFNAVSVPWGAGIGTEQIRWLEATLEDCRNSTTKAIICCHYPTHVDATRSSHVLINGVEILQILDRYVADESRPLSAAEEGK